MARLLRRPTPGARLPRAGRRVLLPAAFLACFIPAVAGAAAAAPRDDVTLNFVNVEIDAAIKVMSELSGRNFIVDPRVKGTVSIVSAAPVSRGAAYEVFLSALRMQGFTVVESEGSARVIPLADAAFNAVPSVDPTRPGAVAGQRVVTQVFQLRNESAAHLVPVLRPLVSPSTPVTALNGSNTLVVTDFADNMRRIARIIESLDQANEAEPVIIPLRYASAADLAHTIARLAGDTGPGTSAGQPADARRVTVVPELRTNSLVIRGDNAARVERMRKLVESLDRPVTGGDLNVVYLKNADATRVAETLRSMYGSGSALGSATPPGNPAGAGPRATAPGSGSAADVNIQPDPANNAIVIRAPEPVYNQIRAVIEKLDTRRAQIFVEALIVEVSSDDAAEFGVQWQSLAGLGGSGSGTQGFGGTAFGGAGQNILDVARNPLATSNGLSIGVVRGAINIPGVGTVTNLSLLARALQKGTKANILSTPNLLTMDNEESRIVIGQNVPFITGQYAQTGAAVGSAVTPTPFQTIERRDIGLTLRIRPQIGEGGAIKLRIYQEVSSVQDRTNAAGIITSKRSIDSTVEVEDGLIVALGGLLEDRFDNSTEQVPGLGSVPVIGNLFKYSSQRQVKTNLMVFLRPVILRDARAADAVSVDRYHYLMQEQARTQPGAASALPDVNVPRLPDLEPRTKPPSSPAR